MCYYSVIFAVFNTTSIIMMILMCNTIILNDDLNLHLTIQHALKWAEHYQVTKVLFQHQSIHVHVIRTLFQKYPFWWKMQHDPKGQSLNARVNDFVALAYCVYHEICKCYEGALTVIWSDIKSGPSIRQIVLRAFSFFGLPAENNNKPSLN